MIKKLITCFSFLAASCSVYARTINPSDLEKSEYTITLERFVYDYMAQHYNPENENAFCITGTRDGQNFEMKYIETPETIFDSNFNSISFQCSPNTLLAIHTHPMSEITKYTCDKFSIQDIYTFGYMFSESGNRMPFNGIFCGGDIFVIDYKTRQVGVNIR